MNNFSSTITWNDLKKMINTIPIEKLNDQAFACTAERGKHGMERMDEFPIKDLPDDHTGSPFIEI